MATTAASVASTHDKLVRAREASGKLAQLSTEEKNTLLLAIASEIERQAESILIANLEDVESSGLEGAMRDRLLLTPARIKEMAQGVRDVAALPDPIGETLAEWTKSNGLRIRKVRVPLGVVGIIYESRPNVTVDTAVLALKTGKIIWTNQLTPHDSYIIGCYGPEEQRHANCPTEVGGDFDLGASPTLVKLAGGSRRRSFSPNSTRPVATSTSTSALAAGGTVVVVVDACQAEAVGGGDLTAAAAVGGV